MRKAKNVVKKCVDLFCSCFRLKSYWMFFWARFSPHSSAHFLGTFSGAFSGAHFPGCGPLLGPKKCVKKLLGTKLGTKLGSKLGALCAGQGVPSTEVPLKSILGNKRRKARSAHEQAQEEPKQIRNSRLCAVTVSLLGSSFWSAEQ